jgi:hypothetical protein
MKEVKARLATVEGVVGIAPGSPGQKPVVPSGPNITQTVTVPPAPATPPAAPPMVIIIEQPASQPERIVIVEQHYPQTWGPPIVVVEGHGRAHGHPVLRMVGRAWTWPLWVAFGGRR